ncbi:MAG: peptidoglycan DD-metalloendopeptidase family protein [Bryobacterales bacterium]|nr:peptidoglycan DD-metalloendopeptidase family protein [Bryobacterales bacterium]
MNRTARVLLGILLLTALASTAAAFLTTYPALPQVLTPTPAPSVIPPEISDTPIYQELPVLPGDTLHATLRRAELDITTESALLQAILSSYDPRKMRAGSAFLLTRTALHQPRKLEYQLDLDRVLEIDIPPSSPADAAPDAAPSLEPRILEIASTTDTVPVCATLSSSLFETISDIGESPELAIRMAAIFAFDLDFNTDPQNGDEFCLVVEKKSYENGQPATYGRIFAATYSNMGKLHDAYVFQEDDGKVAYYSGDGKSLQAAFLKSPLPFAARISSRFSHSRLHPVLKIRRPHLGIDYAAPTGTAVQSVASGVVQFSGWQGGAGNLITIRHSNGFETMYMHLSRRQVKAGETVAVVESVKAASDIYAPVSGTIVAINDRLNGEPGLINTEPFTEGWLFQIAATDPAEMNALMTAEAYRAHIA